ncbi:MAG: pyruvate, phosphate dikinase [Verrucomicrobiota bacterium]|jgi:pyruvate,orthophosphate dikinase|nr:pyruvate, phosphate dikinase [Verrucomicrobiota bacterium]MDP6251371.1 pyruvate, phosphate dikinase [Verrucomicrobiota bacterium]MDP7178099.1 pyruvate, phosphate dikinase [Verrucomicrobiota bacterium]MDP7440440.1 pyruvate, phosphate dikinase [Verrucomicrobiota bacterium]|tara:strand:+ start:99 stop:2810 length:2712 start_codon:yes stop_codon:yes gene_type:complete
MAAKKATKYVYHFGRKTDGNGKMKALLGGKGANLAEMTRIGLPVPPGCTITTEVCTYYTDHKKTYPKVLKAQMEEGITRMERQLGKKFGDRKNPLLLSVRSGARESMPGMMDTILNLGLNDETVEALARSSNNARFAWDSYRRFIQMYGDVVMGVQKLPSEDEEPFEILIEKIKKKHLGNAHAEDTELSTEDLQVLVAEFKKLVKSRTGKVFPNDPWDQLRGAVGAVFSSWMNDRAIVYRRKYNIPADWGTAVNVQSMVFGNSGDNSGSGVAFTRDPATGENVFWGEFMMNAQGEDVVAGVRTPDPVAKLKKVLPSAHKELLRICKVLEKHFRDVQDFEFTIEEEKVFMLQTRNGKRTGLAAVRIACEMVKERLISWKDAVKRIPADDLDQLLAPVFDRAAVKKASAIAKGLPAGPGAATGRVYFNADRAEAAKGRGEEVLLVRLETSPEDLRGMIAANGILTARGGVSSHAALVARQMGKICVCGAADVQINYAKRTMKIGSLNFKEGDYLSIDGTSGEIFSGEVKTAPSEVVQGLLKNNAAAKRSRTYKNFTQIMAWCAKATKMQVRTNADTPGQVKNAIAFGATGIGLCRTEHMFFEGDRIDAVRQMILAEEESDRRKALKKLLPYQRKDFEGIFKSLNGLPGTIRLLDPPLHEFLPHDGKQINDLAKKLKVKPAEIKQRVNELHEFNPMLGHRGCRLAISYPEIAEMQVRAIFEAAANVQKKKIKVNPEIMVPLVGFKKELELQAEIVHRVAKEVSKEKGIKLNYLVGTMIEVPRGALTADEIAEVAEFFSFGTNDLTQTTMGMSRDDSGSFLPNYEEEEIVTDNPFAVVDQTGVGQLMQIAATKGRSTRKNIKLGICGEHGGEPSSVKFCHGLGLNYVSCSPFRVPVARLAAAQAALA